MDKKYMQGLYEITLLLEPSEIIAISSNHAHYHITVNWYDPSVEEEIKRICKENRLYYTITAGPTKTNRTRKTFNYKLNRDFKRTPQRLTPYNGEIEQLKTIIKIRR